MVEVEIKLISGEIYNFNVIADNFPKLIKEINKTNPENFVRFGRYAIKKNRIIEITLEGVSK